MLSEPMAASSMPNTADKMCPGDTLRKMEPRPSSMSMIASVKMLNVLLPYTLPMAMSGKPIQPALMLVAISGSDVGPARRTAPTHTRPRGPFSAMTSLKRTSPMPAATTTSALARNRNQSKATRSKLQCRFDVERRRRRRPLVQAFSEHIVHADGPAVYTPQHRLARQRPRPAASRYDEHQPASVGKLVRMHLNSLLPIRAQVR